MGKSSSVVVGYKYLVAYFHGIAAHAIDAFLEYRAASKTAWSGKLTASGTLNINKPSLFGGDSDQGGIVGDVDVMFGEADQQPNSYLLSAFGSQVPGWRGFTTLVFKGGEFGAMNPYPQKPAYKILATKAGWDDPGCWYPEKAEIVLSADTILPITADGWEYQQQALDANPGYDNLDVPSSGWNEGGQGPFGSTVTGGPAVAPNTNWDANTQLWIRRSITISSPNQQLVVTAENGCVVFINGSIAGAINRTNVQIDRNDENTFVFPLAQGTYELAIKAFDEADVIQNDLAYLTVEIAAPGLTAMNPAHVLYEVRTASDRGQEPRESMADANWKAGADWFYDQGIGLCQCEYNADNESIDDFIKRICQMCACSVNRDPIDGLWYLDIANGVYDIDSLPILTDDDILEFEDTPTLQDDATNSVAVEYYDPQLWTTVTTRPVTSLAAISANGLNHVTNVYHELPTGDLANRFAQRDLMNGITPSHGFAITTTRKPYAWRRNSYFRLQTPKNGIADIVCLLAEKSDGTLKSGAMKISAAPDIYTLASASYMDSEPGVDTRPQQIPTAITQEVIFEVPYYELVRRLTRADLAALPDDVGYLMGAARNPNAARDYTMTVSTDGGTTYASKGDGPFCPCAQIVEGDALVDEEPATDFTLANDIDLGNVQVGAAALWDGEIVRVDAIDGTAKTITLGRGCADTPPVPHAANASIFFYDGFVAIDSSEYTDGETIDAELLTNTGSNQLDPGLAVPLELTFDGRQARPYPPAGMTINGNPYPSSTTAPVSVAFTTRNRVTQADQLIDTAAPDVAAEAGATYTLRGYIGGVLDATLDAQAGSPIVWTPSGPGNANIELVEVLGGIESNPHRHAFTCGSPLWTPASLTAAPKIWMNDLSAATDAGSGRCSALSDISGNGYDFTAPVPSARPLIVANGLNTRRTIHFDGSTNYLLNDSAGALALMQNVGAGWCFAVLKKLGIDASLVPRNFFTLTTTATVARFNMYLGGVTKNVPGMSIRRLDADAVKQLNETGAIDTQFHMLLWSVDWASGTAAIYQDGASNASSSSFTTAGNTSNTASLCAATLGAFPKSSGANPLVQDYGDFELAEIVVGAGSLPSSDEIDDLFGYSAYRWGLQSLLPSGHPYKTDPPTQ